VRQGCFEPEPLAQFCRHEGVQGSNQSPAGQKVHNTPLQFPCRGSGQDKLESPSPFDNPVYYSQKFRDLLDFVENDCALVGTAFYHLSESLWSATVKSIRFRVQEVNPEGILTCLPCQ